MNVLIGKMPTTVNVAGEVCEIDADFRVSIAFELLMQDETVSPEDKIVRALELYYPSMPADIPEAVEQILWFYRCGKTTKNKNGDAQAYSFEHDDGYIYAAFKSQYNVDLTAVSFMHWWQFRSLFQSLGDDNEIVKIMGYRTIKLDSKMSKEQRNFYQRMKKQYKIPASSALQKKTSAVEEALLQGKSLNGIL